MICINAEGCYLTNGKKYEIQYENDNGNMVGVINDIGQLREYLKSAFQ